MYLLVTFYVSFLFLFYLILFLFHVLLVILLIQPAAFIGQTRMEEPQEDLLVVHCFCICEGGALLRGLLGVSTEQICCM